MGRKTGQSGSGNAGGWPSTTRNPSGGGRSNNSSSGKGGNSNTGSKGGNK